MFSLQFISLSKVFELYLRDQKISYLFLDILYLIGRYISYQSFLLLNMSFRVRMGRALVTSDITLTL